MTDTGGISPLSWIDQLEADMEQRNGGFVIRLQEDREAERLKQDDAPQTAIGLIIESVSGSVLAIHASSLPQSSKSSVGPKKSNSRVSSTRSPSVSIT